MATKQISMSLLVNIEINWTESKYPKSKYPRASAAIVIDAVVCTINQIDGPAIEIAPISYLYDHILKTAMFICSITKDWEIKILQRN